MDKAIFYRRVSTTIELHVLFYKYEDEGPHHNDILKKYLAVGEHFPGLSRLGTEGSHDAAGGLFRFMSLPSSEEDQVYTGEIVKIS
ncbi:hypothetical protein G786_02925 [Escherichia coli HVH 126 (4-6034225)]|uniref:hypothetical protein n=1 Tax=Escherichia coli TaxID=562 RepID=UPI00039178CC|nr:hypothetical protein [Escherichia coli]EQR46903.1 hypothetical protein G786_02925 [Escherichia coli HVH 126 (4-6034225)]